MTRATPGGVVVERDGGVLAAVVDRPPDRSLANAVVYEDAAALREALDDLADVYADAGVRAWTVWVRPGDAQTAAALREAGHRLDGEPALMVGTLADMDLEPRASSTSSAGRDGTSSARSTTPPGARRRQLRVAAGPGGPGLRRPLRARWPAAVRWRRS